MSARDLPRAGHAPDAVRQLTAKAASDPVWRAAAQADLGVAAADLLGREVTVVDGPDSAAVLTGHLVHAAGAFHALLTPAQITAALAEGRFRLEDAIWDEAAGAWTTLARWSEGETGLAAERMSPAETAAATAPARPEPAGGEGLILFRHGQAQPPQPKAEVEAALARGDLLPTDWIWQAEAGQWIPLGEVFPGVATTAAAPAPPVAEPPSSDEIEPASLRTRIDGLERRLADALRRIEDADTAQRAAEEGRRQLFDRASALAAENDRLREEAGRHDAELAEERRLRSRLQSRIEAADALAREVAGLRLQGQAADQQLQAARAEAERLRAAVAAAEARTETVRREMTAAQTEARRSAAEAARAVSERDSAAAALATEREQSAAHQRARVALTDRLTAAESEREAERAGRADAERRLAAVATALEAALAAVRAGPPPEPSA